MPKLRPRKRTSDMPQDSSSSENPSDKEISDPEVIKKEDDDSDGWFEPGISSTMKRKKQITQKKKIKKEESDEDEKPFISEYEKIRLQSIAERNELLRSMGINVQENLPSAAPPKKKPKEIKKVKKEKENTPVRMSLRLRGKAGEKISDAFLDESVIKEPEPDIDTRNLGCQRWEEDEMEGREKLLDDLKSKLHEIDFSSDFLNLSSCTRECFRDIMLSLDVKDTPRVLNTRIQSLCVHPNTSKRIVFAGSKIGSLGIWDVDSPDEDSFVFLQPNNGAINCITVNENIPNEIYITSFDGTLTCADINTKEFINTYATSYDDAINHLTWHDQMDANTFLVSHGDGSVLVVDKREKKISKTISCFSRSARTVQIHPNNSNYFLVSSGAVKNGCSVFDIRSKKEISHLPSDKGSTSAFFSPSGLNIVSTCNDDSVKIWDSEDFNDVKQTNSISHNNHTGKWHSVFKAQWYPGRDDVFHVGSLMNPRRIQMYTSKGKLLTELRNSELMVTVQPVIAVHKTLPFIVGGNSSGRLHAFAPPE